MTFRIVLPAIFLLFVMLFFAVNLVGAGHGASTFDFIVYAFYPAGYLTEQLGRVLGGRDWFWSGVAAGAIQWFLVGYLLDKLWRRLTRPKPSANTSAN
jgi:hypothetical protein